MGAALCLAILAGAVVAHYFIRAVPARSPTAPVRCMVVLGSGGHTAEMFYLLDTLPWEAFAPTYVVADTDKGSAQKAAAFETRRGRAADVCVVPRAREVGQSYVTSIGTTLKASAASLRAVWQVRPSLVLCNGPGTCVPIAVLALGLAALLRRRTRVIYAESFACVAHLSLSGRILYPLVHGFAVEWPQLLKEYPRAVYIGRAPHTQAEGQAPGRAFGDFVLVTVGSTVFDELIQAIDCDEFLAVVQHLGFRKLTVQHGATALRLQCLRTGPVGGVEVECLTYSPEVPRLIAEAGLVVSHAGAGSLLDALRSSARVVAVPNERLMNNHQTQLARALAAPGYVATCSCQDLLPFLRAFQPDSLRPYPKEPSPVFRELVRRVMQGDGGG